MAAAAFLAFATNAQADLIISNAPTKALTCSGGACTQTNYKNAYLNVTQLQTLLASSNVLIEPRGGSIIVTSEISWASAHQLELNGAVIVDKPIVATGGGGMYLESLQFGPQGNLTFWSTSSGLEIGLGQNEIEYNLVNSVATLASAIADNPSGNYALAEDYKASGDGTYASSPVPSFSGKLLGLNHTISQLTIADAGEGHQVGLFGALQHGSLVTWLNLKNVRVAGATNSQVGAVAGVSDGVMQNDIAEGVISTGHGTMTSVPGAMAGGLVGLVNNAAIYTSGSSGHVSGGRNAMVGGIVGELNAAGLDAAYSTADVSLDSEPCSWCGVGGPPDSAGGLVGVNGGGIIDSYATGSVTGAKSSKLGGLVGTQLGAVEMFSSYSTGPVSGRGGSSIGGLIGFDHGSVNFQNNYWDLTTSVPYPTRGAGNISDDPGIIGLTTKQLQFGLPAGFTDGSWGESPTINDGLPYLLSNPPR
jgi:hypothetical protein